MKGLEYLGTGLKYPTVLQNGKATLERGDKLIHQSIYVILATPIGERFMLPEFGSRLDEMLFEQNDSILKSMLRLFISEALLKWEKRIKFRDVSFQQEEDTVFCIISYKVLASNEVDSYIYPFYLKLNY